MTSGPVDSTDGRTGGDRDPGRRRAGRRNRVRRGRTSARRETLPHFGGARSPGLTARALAAGTGPGAVVDMTGSTVDMILISVVVVIVPGGLDRPGVLRRRPPRMAAACRLRRDGTRKCVPSGQPGPPGARRAPRVRHAPRRSAARTTARSAENDLTAARYGRIAADGARPQDRPPSGSLTSRPRVTSAFYRASRVVVSAADGIRSRVQAAPAVRSFC